MNAERKDPRRVPAWHRVFLAMLPKIISYAEHAFSGFDPEARQEAVQNVVSNVCVAVAALARRGRLDLCYPTVLARFGIRQTLDHRKVGSMLNIKDVMSPYCQNRKRVVVERLDHFDDSENAWKQAVVQDTRSAPVPEIVAFRCDFADWLQQLKRRDRRIAESLALGHRTSEVAQRFHVSKGRVSQLRSELAQSWKTFVGERVPAAA